MSSAVNPPDSPPDAPVIPEGLATKMGKLGTAILAIVAALGPLLDGFGTEDSKTFATLATIVGVATILGRMFQAAAALRDAPSPGQLEDEGHEFDGMGEDPLVGGEGAPHPGGTYNPDDFDGLPAIDDPSAIPPDEGDNKDKPA